RLKAAVDRVSPVPVEDRKDRYSERSRLVRIFEVDKQRVYLEPHVPKEGTLAVAKRDESQAVAALPLAGAVLHEQKGLTVGRARVPAPSVACPADQPGRYGGVHEIVEGS